MGGTEVYTDGQMDRKTNGPLRSMDKWWMDRWTDGLIYIDGWIDRQMDILYIYGWMDDRIDGWTDRHV